MRRSDPKKVAFGDWQTPLTLAVEVVELLKKSGVEPKSILEPTCGTGAFLEASRAAWPSSRLLGFDINPDYIDAARKRIPGGEIGESDFFTADWERRLSLSDGPVLVLGNPPWVTSSELGTLNLENLPRKANLKGLRGLDAITGKSNFDVSEWMLRRLLGALEGREFILAMLCKTAVARRILEFSAHERLRVRGEIRAFDAAFHFGASVDAGLLIVHSDSSLANPHRPIWSFYKALSEEKPSAWPGVVDGELLSDVPAFERTRHLAGSFDPEWRSGLKHDCARVMELAVVDGAFVNGSGDRVELEDTYVFPLLKCSDLANGRLNAPRAVVVPQRFLGQETASIQANAPLTWSYLERRREDLEARKSSIYNGQPSFSIFGIGEYTFSPWKVAISGLHKRLDFVIVGPRNGKPVVFDDTCYFLPFSSEDEARTALIALRSPLASEFLSARIFWDAKRPVNKAVLQALDLRRLQEALATSHRKTRPHYPEQLAIGF